MQGTVGTLTQVRHTTQEAAVPQQATSKSCWDHVHGLRVLAAGLQEIPLHKLARGSRTELLELLQYLYKYLLSEFPARMCICMQWLRR